MQLISYVQDVLQPKFSEKYSHFLYRMVGCGVIDHDGVTIEARHLAISEIHTFFDEGGQLEDKFGDIHRDDVLVKADYIEELRMIQLLIGRENGETVFLRQR
jgi:hypothetical protein